jgi:general secretion pathway protein F
MTTRLVMDVSHAVRVHGLVGLVILVATGFVANAWLRRPAMRASFDRWVLRLPRIGTLVTAMEIGRFARVLGSLVEGGVPLPDAVAITRRTLGNSHLAAAVGRVGTGLKQGGGLTVSLMAEDIFPPMALSFIRTGEETARLGPMLGRLADTLDREVRIGVEQLIAILTPLITVAMGAIVGGVIASIMTAILGFNDLALAP